MRNFKKIKIKSHGFMLSLVVIGILGAAAFFSPAAFGPAVLDSKKDVIMTEASPPANVENEETTLKQNDEKNKNFYDPLTKEQAAPFIRIAREAFVAQGMAPPETGYWISSTVTKGRNHVEISWYPNGVVFGQETKIKEKVYYALFYNADVDKGVGKMVELGVVWNYGESHWYGENVE
ncbi:hypothetical protein ABER61_09130 [Brevibacillus formosus]|uniref:Uncharacterized protein n=2 Tax=Brevibacillus formosus TaxID=54913 RepID=A0A837KLD5_9BACL|nr:hypothetical protein [Brevibacillus formosus]KLH97811.1 hypothetical protein AA984_18270 [Brevibacillus formosus]PSJ98774.1 hypothetical protein C7R91_05115 [Brevibacillus formosus]GED57491.1 hypothetical protein BFO01nite_16230 [Brevibacillus formosus]